jgi:hypothetical protein
MFSEDSLSADVNSRIGVFRIDINAHYVSLDEGLYDKFNQIFGLNPAVQHSLTRT